MDLPPPKNTAGGTDRAEVMFLLGYCYELLSRYGDAISAYLAVPDGRSQYYGGAANDRLASLATSETAKAAVVSKLDELKTGFSLPDIEERRRNIQAALRLTPPSSERNELLAKLRSVYNSLPRYEAFVALKTASPIRPTTSSSLGQTLAKLGLYDEAAPELRSQMSSVLGPDQLRQVAELYARGGDAEPGILYAEPISKAMPQDMQIELVDRAFLGLLYPAPYRDSLIAHAIPRDVDPRFLLSIMRQESRFRADVKSYAAARGLMQFITDTSSVVAAQLGRKHFEQDELYDPDTAILFGSKYVSDLFALFPSQPAAVAASYNGGEDNMKRWAKRSKFAESEHYVPEIAFSQSKDYVFKVMANYRVYRTLFNEDLTPK